MAREERCVLTNMCMICDGSRILVQDRKNPDWPGVTFPGGHVEPGESLVDSVIREMKEETGLDVRALRLCGVKQFTRRDRDFRYLVFLYQTDCFSGELKSSAEGRVFWIEASTLQDYRLADGFAEMYAVFARDDLSENFWHWENGAWQCTNK